MSIEIISYREVNKGSVVGSVDVYLPKQGMEIYNCLYMRSGDREWISMPSKEYEKDGQKKWFAHVRYREKSTQDAFGRVVIEAIRKHQPKPPQPKEQKMFDEEELPF